MHFKFVKDPPANYNNELRIISGKDSLFLNGREYLIQENNSQIIVVFEIRYEYHCSPFKEVMVVDELLAVGHEAHFYLYDIKKNKSILTLGIEGYFGHVYFNDQLFYVAGALGIKCINKEGNIVWINNGLAIDGTIIDKFEGGKIYGSAELDPPGGWKEFILDGQTGNKIFSS